MQSLGKHLTPRRTVLWAALVGVVVTSLVATAVGCSSTAEDAATGGTAGSAVVAPDFSGVTLDGEQVALSDFRGKPVVVVFMASWCGPCRDEAPELDRFYQEESDRATLLAVAVSDTEADIRGFVAENGLSFPVMLDGDDAASAYGVTAIPTTVVVDAEGHIARRLIGGTTAAALSAIIDGLTR